MHAVDLVDAEPLHEPVLHHGPLAGAAFLRRLEDHHRRAVEIAGLGEVLRGAEQHRRVPVMAAGMHAARDAAGIVLAGPLDDGQRVHVGPQPDGLARPAPPDDADDAGTADARRHLIDAEAPEQLGDFAGGAVHVVLQLGVPVEVAPPGNDLGMELRDAVEDGHETLER